MKTPKTLLDIGYVLNPGSFCKYLPPENVPEFVKATGYTGKTDFIQRFFEIYKPEKSPIRTHTLIREVPATGTLKDDEYWYIIAKKVEKLADKSDPINRLILLEGIVQILCIKNFVLKLIEEGKVI